MEELDCFQKTDEPPTHMVDLKNVFDGCASVRQAVIAVAGKFAAEFMTKHTWFKQLVKVCGDGATTIQWPSDPPTSLHTQLQESAPLFALAASVLDLSTDPVPELCGAPPAVLQFAAEFLSLASLHLKCIGKGEGKKAICIDDR